jgi:integrase
LSSELSFPEIKLGRSSVRYLSDIEERKLFECLDPRREVKGLPPYEHRIPGLKRCVQDAYDLVVLLLDTGARYSEIANVEWSRINLQDRSIRLWRPKVQNEAILFMTDRAFEVLARRSSKSTGNHVFANRKAPRGVTRVSRSRDQASTLFLSLMGSVGLPVDERAAADTVSINPLHPRGWLRTDHFRVARIRGSGPFD